MSKLTEILSHSPVKFNEPVKAPLVIPVRIYSIEKTSEGDVMVQVNDGSFHKLEEKDRNFDLVADALLQRLRQ
jgi:hypothetical protein